MLIHLLYRNSGVCRTRDRFREDPRVVVSNIRLETDAILASAQAGSKGVIHGVRSLIQFCDKISHHEYYLQSVIIEEKLLECCRKRLQ